MECDYEAIDAAAYEIAEYCRKYGRLGGQSKEKYGTVRFYAAFGYLSLHNLTYPGYHWVAFPKWLHTLDLYVLSPVLQVFFERPFVSWQKFIYNRAYQRALRKYPEITKAILVCADYPELIKDTFLREGEFLHTIDPVSGEIIATRMENL